MTPTPEPRTRRIAKQYARLAATTERPAEPEDALRAALEAMGRESGYRPVFDFVHPKVYEKRAECPAWTLQENPSHVHDGRCWPLAAPSSSGVSPSDEGGEG